LKRGIKYIGVTVIVCTLAAVLLPAVRAQAVQDSIDLRYPIREDPDGNITDPGEISPLFLNNPSNIESSIVFDPVTNTYVFSDKIGRFNIRPPRVMSFDEYRSFEMNKAKSQYWKQRRAGDNMETQSSLIPTINIGGEAFGRVFGNNTINIIPQGYAELIFGFNMSKIDNPTLTERLRKPLHLPSMRKYR